MPTAAMLPDLTPWHMFTSADAVVKFVMVLLAAASVATWTILLGKAWEMRAAQRRLRTLVAAAGSSATLEELSGRMDPEAPMLAAAEEEMRLSLGLPVDGTKERIAQRLSRIEAAMARRMARGTGVLATVGAVGPFVGLFGTVWGIMNSFVGIARMQTTNLAVVAPGIAEALLATAAGLVAAIPAVVIYNVFARTASAHRALVGDLAAAIWGLASRDLDRGTVRHQPAVRPVLLRSAAE